MRYANTTGAIRRATLRLGLLSVVMFGFGFLLIPLYDVFCDITGLNGKTADTPVLIAPAVVSDRWVTIEFLAYPGGTRDWQFQPAIQRMRIHPGERYATHYLARNPNQQVQSVRAVPSVAPGIAARHLHKMTCFCFTRQPFAPGESRNMDLSFVLDPDLPAEIGTISLAYTLYLAPTQALLALGDAQPVNDRQQAWR